MKESLECKDLLNSERVDAACTGLGIDLGCDFCRWADPCCTTDDVCEYPSHADVAFAMRRACVEQGLAIDWYIEFVELSGSGCYTFLRDKPDHWIIAATLAWEATQ